MNIPRTLFWTLLLALASGGPSARAGGVSRTEALQTAEAYRLFTWTPTARNQFHGNDPAGVRVDTPDRGYRPVQTRPGWWIPGVANVGVPYKWGGFDTLEEFSRGVEAGRYAGDVYTAAKRKALDDAVSKAAVGIDCSGLVSRCWKLPRSYSTREIPALCVALPSYNDLRPGDVLNTENQHVLLFKGWKDAAHQRLYAYETGAPPTWKVLLDDIPVELLRSQNYRAYRYRLMHD